MLVEFLVAKACNESKPSLARAYWPSVRFRRLSYTADSTKKPLVVLGYDAFRWKKLNPKKRVR